MARNSLLADLKFISEQPDEDVRSVYDRAASKYDHFRDLWLKAAGQDTENDFLNALSGILKPGMKVLDAGCGTGTISRKLLDLEPGISLTLLDLSPKMLEKTSDLPVERLQGSVMELPFADETFDIVVSAWVIETVPHPFKAVSEYLRVINKGGYVLYTFCSLPQGWLSRAGTSFLRNAVKKGFAGNFLKKEDTPWHDCENSRMVKCHGGLSTFISLRKCCSVGKHVLPSATETGDLHTE